MNQDEALLHLELRLLVARYGKGRVAKTLSEMGFANRASTEVVRYRKSGNVWILSEIESVDFTAIETGISAYEDRSKRNKANRKPNKKSIEELVREVSPPNPEVAFLLEKFARAYEKNEFLTELREVRRFLASRGRPISRIQSRKTALPIVLRVLADCSIDELREFDTEKRGGRSDLGIITDQILGHRDNADNSA